MMAGYAGVPSVNDLNPRDVTTTSASALLLLNYSNASCMKIYLFLFE
jgi:hypothetical protein